MSGAVQASVVRLAQEGVLPADTTLGAAVERISGTSEPMFLLRQGAEYRAAAEHDLRAAWHDHVPVETRVWDLARALLVTESIGLARVRLEERPDLDRVIALGDAGTPSLVSRSSKDRRPPWSWLAGSARGSVR